MSDTGQLTSDWVLTAPRLTSREEISERVAQLESKIRDLARKTTTLEAELEAVRRIMDQPWDDSHDRGHDQAFKRLAKISNALNMNSDPLTEDNLQGAD